MDKTICRTVQVLITDGIIQEEQRDTIQYGLDLLLSSIWSLASLMLVGTILGKGWITIGILMAYIPLQSFGGGYHCKTHFKCWITMICGLLFSLLCLMKIPESLAWYLAFACSYPVFTWAPVRHPNAPFGDAFARNMAACTKITYILLLCLALVFQYWLGMSAPILSGIILSGCSIFAAVLKNNIMSCLSN